ncbi:MAG: prolipoprotein diacylglyceryl transferase [Eubacterium sp.]|nr:prolipoprotein diacylglyceryl transferase [Eubacterium sp.]
MTNWLKDGRHALIVILVIGTVFTYWWLLQFRDRLRLNAFTAVPAALVHTAFGVLCVMSFAVLEVWDISAFGNLSIFGATFFMPILFFAFAKLGKRSAADVFDIGCVSMLFTLLCSRFNCLISGCCYGISFFGSDTVLWPTRELEIAFYAVLITVLAIKTKRNQSRGRNYPIYMIAYGVFRFILEWFRFYGGNSVIHRAHIWAVVSLCLGLSILAEINTKQKKVRS